MASRLIWGFGKNQFMYKYLTRTHLWYWWFQVVKFKFCQYQLRAISLNLNACQNYTFYVYMIAYMYDGVILEINLICRIAGKLSREKVFTNFILRTIHESLLHKFGHVPPTYKIELAFSEKYESLLHKFGHVPPTYKIELAFSEKFSPWNYHFLLIRESFLPQMFPAIWYLWWANINFGYAVYYYVYISVLWIKSLELL